ncbi:MAG: histidinol phosphate phosphatase [Zavarzinella sp.]|nr:histidinol phosphate phosphatase [Zavarzinella sp.]
MNAEWRSRYEVMVEAARAAGQVALGYFDRDVAVQWKEDRSPVTVADRNAEQALRERLSATFPNDGFLGEEFGTSPGSTGYRWIIDPIDGTRSFVRNIPHWATLVGLEYRGEMIAGVSYAPADGQLYRALRGEGAYKNDRRVRVSDVVTLDKALAAYSGVQFFQKAGKERQFLNIVHGVDRARGFGDYYGFVLVAQGSCDLMVDYGVHIWDIAGLKVIVEEAGGRFSDWDGAADLERPDCVATNGKLHNAALELLRS